MARSPERVVQGVPSDFTKISRFAMNRIVAAFSQQIRNHSVSVRACRRASAVTVLSKPPDPFSDLVAIERRIEPDPSGPAPAQSGVGLRQVDFCAIPRPRIRSARVEVERPQGVDDPPWRDDGPARCHGLLVRAEGHFERFDSDRKRPLAPMATRGAV